MSELAEGAWLEIMCMVITVPGVRIPISPPFIFAGVMELADVVDSKSTGSDTVPVRVRPPAPYNLVAKIRKSLIW